jgi:ankyrin repeat protein
MSHEFRVACELHSADRLRAALAAGLDARRPIDGKAAITWLTEMYTRSDRFTDCLRVLLEHGAVPDDPSLAPVLLNDAAALAAAALADPHAIRRRVAMTCAFTPLAGVSWLHVAAEFGHLEAVRALIALGADVNDRADLDADGLGGHTPLFHAVNSHAHRSAPVMHALLAAGADPQARVAGLTWGRGFEWETTFFDLTPIAYAQLGLLPQMHRDARDVDAAVRALLSAAGRAVPAMPNVPNRYLAERGDAARPPS